MVSKAESEGKQKRRENYEVEENIAKMIANARTKDGEKRSKASKAKRSDMHEHAWPTQFIPIESSPTTPNKI